MSGKSDKFFLWLGVAALVDVAGMQIYRRYLESAPTVQRHSVTSAFNRTSQLFADSLVLAERQLTSR